MDGMEVVQQVAAADTFDILVEGLWSPGLAPRRNEKRAARSTLRAPTIRKLIKAGEMAQTMFDERDLAEISSPEFRGERLIVCRNPILADQRRRVRSTTAVLTGSVRMSCCACSPTTWSGTCAAGWRRCCSTTCRRTVFAA